MTCKHQTTRKTKILKLGSNKYLQCLEYCVDCRAQVSVKVEELKKRDH